MSTSSRHPSDLPLRGKNLRDDGLLGNDGHNSRPAAVLPGLDAPLAGSLEDRLLQNARRAAQRADAHRAQLRSRGSVSAQSRRGHDLTVNGPELAGQALKAGLVDEIQMIVYPRVLGGGKPFFPVDLRLNLELLDQLRFRKGEVLLR